MLTREAKKTTGQLMRYHLVSLFFFFSFESVEILLLPDEQMKEGDGNVQSFLPFACQDEWGELNQLIGTQEIDSLFGSD